ncbi:MAG: Spy/CpxP family protein refolding chaperone [Alphaproteobacteria bacterium]|nr:Spy/CpxP family protein refolding chaperone [Alphaproteobacteria bacterium]MBV9374600.1 Spy/CpxP family protein refolding chaperone [Alphaproteobacteria bacterium]MBV9815334.1 Spy/CpxP family protein refolding chaperone [Alphaproteobacteria bacterium]
MIRVPTSFLAAALFTGVAAIGLTPAWAQTTPQSPNTAAAPSDARHRAMEHMMPGKFVDGRIAFLKTELKITPAQEAQWQQVEAAMRENAKQLDQTITTAHQNRGNMDAVQRLELREQFAKVRADNDARLLAAFKPLYTSLSPEQQQMANQLVGARHHWYHRA